MKKLFATAVLLSSSVLAFHPISHIEWKLGLTANAFSAGGKPSNYILGKSLFLRKMLSSTSNVVGALNLVSGADFEEPAHFLGIFQDQSVKAIDSKSDRTTLSVWYEQTFGSDIDNGFFGRVGGGRVGGSVVDVEAEPVSGDVEGGGQFQIITDARTELGILADIRYTRPLTERLSFISSLDVGYTTADWTVMETVAGTTRQFDDYSTYGARLDLSYSS